MFLRLNDSKGVEPTLQRLRRNGVALEGPGLWDVSYAGVILSGLGAVYDEDTGVLALGVEITLTRNAVQLVWTQEVLNALGRLPLCPQVFTAADGWFALELPGLTGEEANRVQELTRVATLHVIPVTQIPD